ncbi:MAG: sugar ABC transporter permease [bacterium]|nr:sugar ABC transporter permease [bacterium]
MNDLDFLRLSKPQQFVQKLKRFFLSLPRKLAGALKGLVMRLVGLVRGLGSFLADLGRTYVKGDWKTKVSYTVMGFGSAARGQWLRGLLFFVFQTVFNLYIWFFGRTYLGKLATLGTVETAKKGRVTVYGDNSFLILLYGVLTIFFIAAFIYTWYVNIKQNKLSEMVLKSGRKLKSARDDMASLLDTQFHKTLLALPTLGVTVFTILPIIFMILVAFTNYDNQHQPPGKLFTWVGTANFETLLTSPESDVRFEVTSSTADSAMLTITAKNGDILTVNTADPAAAVEAAALTQNSKTEFTLTQQADGSYQIEVFNEAGESVSFVGKDLQTVKTPSFSYTFRQVLLWTLIWAFFATFLNYFLGMLVAIMINKKGIRFKKLWRTILVMTIAIPQFISLLYVSKMFAADGLVNGMLMNWGWISQPLPFWTDPSWARVTIIAINVWIGIPYLMLIATGILMNIPADLYESARIDGANAFQTYMKITLPYMLFVTGPYLLTSFTSNINNFNVIFLLSQGKPLGLELAGNAGTTDLLITWLYKMTVTDSNYKLAAVMGILVFVVCAVINLVVYNFIPSVKNEEDFQ